MNKTEYFTLIGFLILLIGAYFIGNYTGYVRGYNEAYAVCIDPINPNYNNLEYIELYINTTDNTTLYHENGNYNGSYEVLNE